MKKISFVFIWMVLLSVGAQAEVVDWIVAMVNDDIILNSELERKVDQLENQQPAGQNMGGDRSELKQTVLRQIILERLSEQEAKRYKIAVSPGEVDRAIEEIKKENGFSDAQMEYVLSQEGQTLDQLKENIRREIIRSRLLERVLKSKTVITDEQIDAYLKEKGPIETADRRRLGVIFLPTSTSGGSSDESQKLARQIHSRLKEGEDFAKLAREYSKGPAAKEGGDIGYMASNELAPAIEKATRGLGPGKITDVVETAGGYYLLKVLDVEQKQEDPADPNVRERIRRKLFQEEINQKYENWIRELESKAFIQIHPEPSESSPQPPS